MVGHPVRGKERRDSGFGCKTGGIMVIFRDLGFGPLMLKTHLVMVKSFGAFVHEKSPQL